jgi:hypothetical protein
MSFVHVRLDACCAAATMACSEHVPVRIDPDADSDSDPEKQKDRSKASSRRLKSGAAHTER